MHAVQTWVGGVCLNRALFSLRFCCLDDYVLWKSVMVRYTHCYADCVLPLSYSNLNRARHIMLFVSHCFLSMLFLSQYLESKVCVTCLWTISGL